MGGLGSMEYEVLPVDHVERTKHAKPYDQDETKRPVMKSTPEV